MTSTENCVWSVARSNLQVYVRFCLQNIEEHVYLWQSEVRKLYHHRTSEIPTHKHQGFVNELIIL